MPGLINSHHHVGLTPFQLGAPDLHNELWKGYRMTARTVDPYLDTLYSAFEMIESGVTTVQQSRVDGPVDLRRRRCRAGLTAHRGLSWGWWCGCERISGVAGPWLWPRSFEPTAIIRCPCCPWMRRSPTPSLVVRRPKTASSTGPTRTSSVVCRPTWRPRWRISFAPNPCPVSRSTSNSSRFRLHERHNQSNRARAHPVGAGKSAADGAPTAAFSCSRSTPNGIGSPMHMHLLETPYEKVYAQRRDGEFRRSLHLHDLGLLGPNLTLGHANGMGD